MCIRDRLLQVLFVVFDKAWVLGPTLCKLVLYVQIVTLASTTFILTAMSVDRYLAICHPLQRTCRPGTIIDNVLPGRDSHRPTCRP